MFRTKRQTSLATTEGQDKSGCSAVDDPCLSVELLEDRRLLTVNWTGDAGDGLWNDPDNWSTMAVPTSTDDVVIGSAGSPTVTVDNDEFANSISVAAGATLSLAQSGFLTVYADSTINGTLSMSGAALAVDEPV